VSSIGSNVEYAGAHEFGSAPYDILPRRGKALRFMIGNKIITVAKVHHPGVAKRAPIARGIEDRTENYRHAIGHAITSTWEQT
jgi:hypothetical protein